MSAIRPLLSLALHISTSTLNAKVAFGTSPDNSAGKPDTGSGLSIRSHIAT